jgi:hypothetical protein
MTDKAGSADVANEHASNMPWLLLMLLRVFCFRYGLLGLLHVIRMTEPDLTMLALGTDLTGLGLNLNAPDSLYKVRVLVFLIRSLVVGVGWVQSSVLCLLCAIWRVER